MAEKIFIVDRMTARPGRGKALLEAYLARYAPAARQRGMTLEHRWVAPPLWLDEQSNTLMMIWSVDGAAAWWQMSFVGRRDPSVAEWWREAETMILDRDRSFYAADEALGSLADV